jgi:hypothetical protein
MNRLISATHRAALGVAVFLLCCVTLGGAAFAGGAAGAIRGKVTDPSGAPIAGATVTLANPVTGYSQEVRTEGDGSYTLYNIPFNSYTIKVEASNFGATAQSVIVRSALTMELDLSLSVSAASETVIVDADQKTLLETDSSTTHVDIDKSLIRRFPAATALRGVESIILSAPGFIADENGRFHVRGSHAQTTYVVDGVPVSDQLHLTFSNSLDPSNFEAIEVITGNQLPEYGGRNAATINVTTRSGLGSGRPFFGNVTLGGARFSTGEVATQFGGELSKKFGYFVSAGATRSNRFSDPPVFENLNNTGDSQRMFARFDYAATERDQLRLTTGLGRTRRDIPNLPSQHLAGQRQTSFLKDLSVNFSATHVFSPKISAEIAPYYRTSAAQLVEDSPLSTPISVQQDRHLSNYGFNATFNYDETLFGRFRNRFKAGTFFFRFPVSENFNFAITDPNFNAPPDDPTVESEDFNPNLLAFDLTRGGQRFQFTDKRIGSQSGFYVQDAVTFGNLSINGGVRYDNYKFLQSEDAFQPRVGVAYHIPQSGTVLRASYNRLFFTPYNENLLITNSPLAGSIVPDFVADAQGSRQANVRGERQNAYEVGVQQRVKNFLRVDFAYWTKDSKQASDNSQFLNTGIVFPVAFAGAKLRGADLRIDVPQKFGFSGYVSFGTTRAVFSPPFTGGLFLDPEVAEIVNEGPFRIDHDQKFSSQFGVQYDNARRGFFLGFSGRYDSGLVTEIEGVDEIAADPDVAFGLGFVNLNNDPTRVRPRTIYNASAGYQILRGERYKLEVQTHLLNLTNKQGLFNFLSVFGGTHVIPPRTFAARVKLSF